MYNATVIPDWDLQYIKPRIHGNCALCSKQKLRFKKKYFAQSVEFGQKYNFILTNNWDNLGVFF